ncbi:hypothetical protein [Frigoribacterium sp. UYMn621]|uniref:hypothetical protein n=1 Tax=Frigoribacterium sp. UYMn621 TaxID=3156343 RepID=UPI0033947030
MPATESALLMTMSDIAALARVRRPVVTVWRTRAARNGIPFPAPVFRERGQEFFDAGQVGSWLAETGRGNNPEAAADAAAHAAPPRSVPAEGDTFSAVTALLTLRSLIGGPLSALSPDELLDAADELDPDDDLLYREVESAGGARESLARYVDELVEAAYTEAAAFETLMADRSRADRRDIDDTVLSGSAIDLMSRTATVLAATLPGDPVVVDVTGSVGDVLIAIAKDENAARDLTVCTAGGDGETARLARRRLAVHRIPRTTIDVYTDGAFVVTGNVVHVAVFPPSSNVLMDAASTLSAIDHIVLQMDPAQLAVVMAPSVVLSDANLEREADQVRSALLRSGRVRAIVRLPIGLRPRKPQQAHTIWVLGDAYARVELAERWTMVADLSALPLDQGAIDDLVGDLAAALGDLATVRAHAFRFARLVLTRTLLASRDSLVAGARTATRPPPRGGAALAVRIDQLVSTLSSESNNAGLPRLTVEHATPANEATMSSVEQLIAAGHLRYIPGNRLDPDDVIEGMTDAAGIRIIGPAEVLGEHPLGRRRIDRLRFAAGYPAGRVTEPGDVVFCTTPRPAAIVDTEGTSVVTYPARILRVNPSDPGGLLAEVVAVDVLSLASTHKEWRRWLLRQTRHRQRAALSDALASIRLQQERARERLARLDELTSLLITGVSAGTVTLTHTSDLPAPPEGTT